MLCSRARILSLFHLSSRQAKTISEQSATIPQWLMCSAANGILNITTPFQRCLTKLILIRLSLTRLPFRRFGNTPVTKSRIMSTRAISSHQIHQKFPRIALSEFIIRSFRLMILTLIILSHFWALQARLMFL